MRQIALIFALALMVSFVNGQVGPKAKNAKPWNKQLNNTVIVASVERENIIGPKAKNSTPKERTEGIGKVEVKTATSKRVTGPKAKNAKPWLN